MNKPILNEYAKKFFEENHGILNTNELQTIVKFIESLPNDLNNHNLINSKNFISENLNPEIIFDDNYFKLSSEKFPNFLKSYGFQDEYEANLAGAVWLQYSKKAKKDEHGLALMIDYNPYL